MSYRTCVTAMRDRRAELERERETLRAEIAHVERLRFGEEKLEGELAALGRAPGGLRLRRVLALLGVVACVAYVWDHWDSGINEPSDNACRGPSGPWADPQQEPPVYK